MVNRRSYRLVKAYLSYLLDVRQLDQRSVDRFWAYLKYLLIWADETPFHKAHTTSVSFASYLSTTRLDGNEGPLAPTTLKKVVQVSKRFFAWLVTNYPRQFSQFPRSWTAEIRPPRAVAQQPAEHEFVTLEQVLCLLALDAGEDMAFGRDQVAAAFLFLSGMRASAFVSIPIKAVDLTAWEVKQWPSLGVRTKNGKAATTYLLDIPELREAVQEWDAFIRPQLPATAAWYTPIISQWGEQTLSADPPGSNRHVGLARRIRKLFEAADLPYLSPHKFRHGHAVFALQHAQTMADYKAVSMNLMHADIRVTDGIYAPLAGDEVQERIAGLTGSGSQAEPLPSEIAARLNGLSNAELGLLLNEAASRLTASDS